MGTREKYRSPKRFGYVGSPSDCDGKGVSSQQRGSGSWMPGSGSRIPVPLRVLEIDLETVSQGKTVAQCTRVGEQSHAPVQTSSQGEVRSSQGEVRSSQGEVRSSQGEVRSSQGEGSESGEEEALWANLDRWGGGGRRLEERETSEERELHWLADRSGGEELAEELVTILEESSEEWEEEEEEEEVDIVEVGRTARVIEVIEGSEEDEEEDVEGQEAVTIKVEDLEDVIEEAELTEKEMDDANNKYGNCKDIVSEVMAREGLVSASDGREGLVQALPAVVVEDFGGSENNFGEEKEPAGQFCQGDYENQEKQPVGQFCQGEYENLAPANQYYEQVRKNVQLNVLVYCQSCFLFCFICDTYIDQHCQVQFGGKGPARSGRSFGYEEGLYSIPQVLIIVK